MTTLILAIFSALGSSVLILMYMRVMRALTPLERSNHASHIKVIPSGAGVAMMAVVLVLWPLSQGLMLTKVELGLLGVVAGLAVLSWVDDHRPIAPAVRLAALAVALLLVLLDPRQRVWPSVPIIAERAVLGLAWIWFINLFNFMDGIDGLAGCEALAIAAGYLLAAVAGDFDTPLTELAVIVAAACAGYLVLNWYPAKVFMGDAGSISLGFLLGWLMIDLACRGLWAAALILPLYFGADATLTLIKRLMQGEKPWQRHRQHYYQRAVLGNAKPSAVVWRINATNAALLTLAVLSLWFPVSSLIAAGVAVAGLLSHLEQLANSRATPAANISLALQNISYKSDT